MRCDVLLGVSLGFVSKSIEFVYDYELSYLDESMVKNKIVVVVVLVVEDKSSNVLLRVMHGSESDEVDEPKHAVAQFLYLNQFFADARTG